MLGSCGVFGIAMNDLAEADSSIAVVTADLCSFSGLERFKARHGDYFYNIGIAEQNLLGVAAGLANEGFNVFASTYASFATTRALDQVRVDMGYMKLPIKLVGLTSGFSVGILGATHMAIEDIAIMRSIPNIIILSPADGVETYKAIVASANLDKPVYIRLSGTMNNPVVYAGDYDFEIGKIIELKSDGEIAIFATGTMVYEAWNAIRILEKENIHCGLYDVHTIKPLDRQCIEKIVADISLIVTVEEHSVIGGLGGAIAELISKMSNRPPFIRVGVKDKYDHAGSYEYLKNSNKLNAAGIAEYIKKYLRSL